MMVIGKATLSKNMISLKICNIPVEKKRSDPRTRSIRSLSRVQGKHKLLRNESDTARTGVAH